MAIQFPPSSPGDPEPVDGQIFIDPVSQEEFTCRRSSPTATAQWIGSGILSNNSFSYRGTLNIQQTAPFPVTTGNIYSVADGGIADSSYGSTLSGTQVDQWSLVIYEGPNWSIVSAASSSAGPWIRAQNASGDYEIQPVISTDNLNMYPGNFLINELDELL